MGERSVSHEQAAVTSADAARAASDTDHDQLSVAAAVAAARASSIRSQ